MKPNWKYISLFLALAIGVSAPVHLGYLDGIYQKITNGWMISDWIYMVAGIGPFIAALITLFLQKTVSRKCSKKTQLKSDGRKKGIQ